MTKIDNFLAHILFEYENKKSTRPSGKDCEVNIHIPLKYHGFISNQLKVLNSKDSKITILVREKDVFYKKSSIARSSDVFFVEIAGKQFVIKRHSSYVTKIIKSTEHITRSLKGGIVPKLFISGYLNDNSYIQIYSFVDGKHIYRPLVEKEIINFINLVKHFHKNINSLDQSELEYQTLYEKISSTQKCIADNEFLSQVGDYLIGCDWIFNTEQFLTHYDLHRDNIIINEDLNTVTLLDLDAIILAPNEFQPASLIMAGFFLYENYDESDLDLLIDFWDQNLNKQKVYTLMIARSWIGACFFWRQIYNTSSKKRDKELYNLYENKTRYLQRIVLNYSQL